MRKREEIESSIFKAAQARFSRHGYGKTTMAEIASDCDVSPAHLYNFFPGKLEIAAAIVRNDADKLVASLSKVVNRKNAKAPAQLRSFLMTEMRERYKKLDGNPGALELALRVAEERPEAAEMSMTAADDLLVALLKDGQKSKQLKMKSAKAAADAIQLATLRFRYAWVLAETPLKQLEKELDGVIALLLDGVKA